LTNFGGIDAAQGVAIQADGKIVVVGIASTDLAVARYNSDGSLDTSFDGDGKVTTNFGAIDSAQRVTIQSDGKIVVAGGTGTSGLALARSNANGSLDTDFDGDGLITAAGLGNARGLALDSSGRIVTVTDSRILRFSSTGSLDTNFDGDGVVTAGGASVAIQSD